MGILRSTSRFFGCKTEDEEEEGDERPIYLSLFHGNGGGESSEQLPKKSSVFNSIYNAVQLGFRFVFGFVWRRKTANHVLPIQNTSKEPLLVQTTYNDEGRSQTGVADILSYQHQQWRPEKKQRDPDVVVPIPGLTTTKSDEGRSQRGIVDILSYKQLQQEKKQRDRDEVLSIPGLTTTKSDEGRSQRRIVDILSYKQLQPEKKQRDRDMALSIPGLTTTKSDEGRSQRGIVNILSYEQLQQQKKQRDRDVVLSIPGLTTTKSDEGKSQRGIADILKQLQQQKKQRDRDGVLSIPGSSTTNSNEGRSQRGIVDNLSYKQLQQQKKQIDRNVVLSIPESVSFKSGRYKEKVSSLTSASVRIDSPRNVTFPGMKKAEEKKVSIKSSSIIVIEERWIKHYSSRHRILLVGDGDFSFSASLAEAFSSAPNIIATSLDSQEFLMKNYFKAASNIEKLRGSESKVMHEVDVTKMANHPTLGHLKFDRIIFNFPYAGLANIKKMSRESQLRRHRRLVGQFLKNAREMICENGEIHITHKTNSFHLEFRLESTASCHRLKLIEALNFNCLDFPGYYPKFGFGGDGNFDCYPSKTYKFAIKKKS